MSKSPLPWLLVVLAVTSVAIVAVVGVAGSAQGATPDLEAPPTSATLEAFHAYTEAQLKLWREELAYPYSRDRNEGRRGPARAGPGVAGEA